MKLRKSTKISWKQIMDQIEKTEERGTAQRNCLKKVPGEKKRGR